jgi:hypothetical protein
MMELTQIWHHHRPALAEVYLQTLNAGIVVSTTIFAPRRTGKTSFLRKDLMPAAEAAGFCVVYADLWQTRQAPGVALARALEQALAPRSLPEKIAARLNAPVKALKAGAEIAGAKVSGEVALDSEKPAQPEMALQIATMLEALCKKGPVLLLVDEAQELARSKESELVATALRTAITLNQQRLRVVFTGSSRSQLANVFSNSNAPLYSTGAAITDFPLLDRGFVKYVKQQYENASGRVLDEEAAWEAFQALKRQPEPFLKGIMSMVLSPSLTLEQAMQMIREELLRSENHEGTWATLDATRKELVKMLARNPMTKPFSREVLAELRRLLGIDTLKHTHVQRAMTRLAEAGIVFKVAGGTYEFENTAFLQWVRTLAD